MSPRNQDGAAAGCAWVCRAAAAACSFRVQVTTMTPKQLPRHLPPSPLLHPTIVISTSENRAQAVACARLGPRLLSPNPEAVHIGRCKNEPKELKVTVEKGSPDGHEVRFKGASEQTPGQVPGDVIVSLRQKSHSTFTRKGNDLHMTMEISLKEALTGFTRTVRQLDGETAPGNSPLPSCIFPTHSLSFLLSLPLVFPFFSFSPAVICVECALLAGCTMIRHHNHRRHHHQQQQHNV